MAPPRNARAAPEVDGTSLEKVGAPNTALPKIRHTYTPHIYVMRIGSVFRSLTVIGPQVRERGSGNRSWRLCRCVCGVEVMCREDRLRGGRRVSCGRGCRYVEMWPLYRAEKNSWANAIARCFDARTRGYANYGGRGITVCDSWRRDFWAFLSDMGPRPGRGYSLDRIDVNRSYEPGNCRWATMSEQRRNSRDTIFVEFDGMRRKLCDLCEELGKNYAVVNGRLNIGWSLTDALANPVRPYRKKNVL